MPVQVDSQMISEGCALARQGEGGGRVGLQAGFWHLRFRDVLLASGGCEGGAVDRRAGSVPVASIGA